MPYVMDWPPKRLAVIALVVLGLLFAASPALADGWSYGGSCPVPPSSPVLSQLGDSASYSLLPGGNFEGDMSGWSLNNASVVSGNESLNVGGASDSQSLSIAPGGSAVAPPICVSNMFPSWRFFAVSNPTGSGDTSLHISAQWSLSNGMSGQVPVTSLSNGNYSSWQLTPSLTLGSVLRDGFVVTVRLVFTAGNSSQWSLDDIYVDPYAK